MAQLPASRHSTVSRIYEAWEAKERGRFPYSSRLGPGVLGESCDRKVWYGIRWATRSSFPGRMLRLFNRGHREEEVIVQELRDIGCEVQETDPRTKEQWKVESLGGHLMGRLDGIIARGVPEAEKSPHVLECKTMNDRSFRELSKKGVKEAQPKHWTQANTYMGRLQIERALYVAVNKNTDELYVERIHYDHPADAGQMKRAERIIASARAPQKVAESPTFFECKFCQHSDTCHGGRIPEASCRTCRHSSPVLDGEGATWRCHVWKADIPDKHAQLQGCERHSYLEAFVPDEVQRKAQALGWGSRDLERLGHADLLEHEATELLAREFDARPEAAR